MRSLVIFALVLAAFTSLSEARHLKYKRDAIEPAKDAVIPTPALDFKAPVKELPKPDHKEIISELDDHKEIGLQGGSSEEKHNHSKEEEKHSHEHNKDKKGHKHSKEHSKEKDSGSKESSEQFEGDFIAIIAVIMDPESHRPRLFAQEMPAPYSKRLLL